MSSRGIIIWTPQQREKVIHFLRLYADKIEEKMNNSDEDYGLPQAQSGALHIVDMVIPTGVEYIANRGPRQSIRDGVEVVLASEELRLDEDAIQGQE